VFRASTLTAELKHGFFFPSIQLIFYDSLFKANIITHFDFIKSFDKFSEERCFALELRSLEYNLLSNYEREGGSSPPLRRGGRGIKAVH